MGACSDWRSYADSIGEEVTLSAMGAGGEEKKEEGSEEEGGGEEDEANWGQGGRRCETVRHRGVLVEEADGARADEAAEAPDGVDEGEGNGDSGAGEKFVGHGPERTEEAAESDFSHAKEKNAGERSASGDEQCDGGGGGESGNESVEFAFEMAIGAARDENHGDGGDDAGNHDQQADGGVGKTGGERLDDLGCPEAHGVARGHDGEVDGDEVPDARVFERGDDGTVMPEFFGFLFF